MSFFWVVGLTFLKNQRVKLFLIKIHKFFKALLEHSKAVRGYVFRVFTLLAFFYPFYTQRVNGVFFLYKILNVLAVKNKTHFLSFFWVVGLTFLKNQRVKLFLIKIHQFFKASLEHPKAVRGYVFRVFTLLAFFYPFYTQRVNGVFFCTKSSMFWL